MVIDVRPGAGENGSDRVSVALQDNLLVKTWIQVKVKATANTGLAADKVFYFGNAIGETGNNPSGARVETGDSSAVRQNPCKTLANPAGITNVCDFNRDKRANTADEILVRTHATTVVDELKLITVP